MPSRDDSRSPVHRKSRRESPRPARRRRRSSTPRRESPSYKPYVRDEHRGRDRHSNGGDGWGPGGGDWRRGGGENDVSEDDIREQAKGDYMEFRRLKRIKLADRNVRCIWHNTPSPPPGEEADDDPLDNGHATEGLANGDSDRMDGGAAPHANGDKPRQSGKGHPQEPEHAAADAADPDASPGEPSGDDQKQQEGQESANDAVHAAAAALFREWLAQHKAQVAREDEERRKAAEEAVLVGPVLPAGEGAHAVPGSYGGALRPGEGEAMAAFVQSGKRIPRRGEVGLTADQISKFEDLGYVMSGSRHSRMNAIRIRKENQVYTAEEKAALAMYNFEENKKKEQKILADMQRLVERTLGDDDEDEPAGDAPAIGPDMPIEAE